MFCWVVASPLIGGRGGILVKRDQTILPPPPLAAAAGRIHDSRHLLTPAPFILTASDYIIQGSRLTPPVWFWIHSTNASFAQVPPDKHQALPPNNLLLPDGPADLRTLSVMIGNWVFYDEKNGANENARNVPIKSGTSASGPPWQAYLTWVYLYGSPRKPVMIGRLAETNKTMWTDPQIPLLES